MNVAFKVKLTDMPYPKAAKFRAKECLELVHSDIAGPFKVHTIGGKTYFLTFVADYKSVHDGVLNIQ